MKTNLLVLMAFLFLFTGCDILDESVETGSLTVQVVGAPSGNYIARFMPYSSAYSGYKKTGLVPGSSFTLNFSNVPIGSGTFYIAFDGGNSNYHDLDINDKVGIASDIYIGGSESITVSNITTGTAGSLTLTSLSGDGIAYCIWLPTTLEPRLSFFVPEQVISISQATFSSGTATLNTITSKSNDAPFLYPNTLYNVFCFIDRSNPTYNYIPDYNSEYVGSFKNINSSVSYNKTLSDLFIQ